MKSATIQSEWEKILAANGGSFRVRQENRTDSDPILQAWKKYLADMADACEEEEAVTT